MSAAEAIVQLDPEGARRINRGTHKVRSSIYGVEMYR